MNSRTHSQREREKYSLESRLFTRKPSMKCTKQQKRKAIDVTKKQDECWGISLKKPAKGMGRGYQKATESMKMPHLEPQIQCQIPPAKIKLQLFPINENTRLGLEKDGYNPFLELTLSARKKISSVGKHLNTKWGSSSVAIGQIILFPYKIKLDEPASCRWTSNDSAITAGEVYVAVESPSFFRLRYGWSSNLHPEMLDMSPKSSCPEDHIDSEGKSRCYSRVLEIKNHQEENICEATVIQKQINVNETLLSDANEMKALDVLTDNVDDEVSTYVVPVRSTIPWDDNLTNFSIGGLPSEISLQGKFNGSDLNSSMQSIRLTSDISVGGLLSEASLLGKICNPATKSENESTSQCIVLASSDISIGGLLSEASLLSDKSKFDTQTKERGHAQFQSPWDDNLTTLSIGGLLSEASLQGKAGCNPELKDSIASVQHNPPLSDSFDAFITAQLNAHSEALKLTCCESNLSILDAEETCHAFPTWKLQPSCRDAMTSNIRARFSGCSNSKPFPFPYGDKINNETMLAKDSPRQEVKTNPLPRSLVAFDEDSSLGLSDINWNESREPFDLVLPSRQVTGACGDSVSISEHVR